MKTNQKLLVSLLLLLIMMIVANTTAQSHEGLTPITVVFLTTIFVLILTQTFEPEVQETNNYRGAQL